MTVQWVFPQLFVKDDSKPEKKKKEVLSHGLRTVKCQVPDSEILAMRRMHQIERKTAKEVIAAFPQYHWHYVREVLAYTIRNQKHLWVNGG